MEFKILGPLVVEEEGRQLELGGARQRALLAILLLHRGQVVPNERLIEDLYGGKPPPSAATALRAHVSRLRRALGKPEILRTEARGYELDLEHEQLDLDEFDDLVERGRNELARGNAEVASSALTEAMALWRGPPLADFRYDEFAQAEMARLDEKHLAAIEDRIDADLALGRHVDLVPELEKIVSSHPLRERPRGQFMLALYRSGRQAEALDVYTDTRRVLTEELGLEPSEELKKLQRAILEHEPGIATPSRIEVSRRDAATDFVGRSAELETMHAALDHAFAGHGRLLLISGEPGIGKSRLSDELIGHARRRVTRVLVGRCWEAGGAPAYWPWVQSLRTYIRDSAPDALDEQLGAGASDLAQLFPELRELYPDLPEPPARESEGARFRLFDAMAAFLKNASRARPIVLVLDDLHAADEPSLLLLRFLARELGDSRLLIVGAYRDVDPSLRDPLLTTLSELAREPATQRISLSGLAEAEVGAYISRAAKIEPDASAVAKIHADTDGNPLFVGEIVRLLVAEGRLGEATKALEIPSSIREVIGSRMRRLSEPSQKALVIASVLGREFAVDSLGHMSRLSREALLDVLDEAMAERVVGEVPGTSGRVRFAHALIRDTLYDELTSARRIRLHREAGEALEQVYASDLEPHLAEIALHFFYSAPGGTADKAIEYARRASGRAVSLLAYEEAVRLYELALTLVEDDRERCDLLLALGDAQARAGDTPASKRTYREAAELAGALGLSEQLGRGALGYGGRILWDVSRDDDYLVPLLERALAALGNEDSTLRVRLLARLAGPVRDTSFPPERKASLSRDALAMARRIGDPATLAYALDAYIPANESPENTRELLELSTELLGVATEVGDKERAVEAHEHRLNRLLELGEMAEAHAALEAMAELAEELRQPAQDWLVGVHRARLALLEGRLAEAEVLISEARSVGERALSWYAAVVFGLQLYVLRREQDRLCEVEELIRCSVEDYPTYPVWRCVLAQIAAELGHEAESREAFAALATDDFAGVPFGELWLVSMSFLAETAASLRDTQRGAVLYELLFPYSDRVGVSYPEISTGPVSRYLGLLAATLQRWDDAERHFEDALEMNERIGARPWVARTQHDYADMLLERGVPDDEERARALTRAAHALADEIGMSFS